MYLPVSFNWLLAYCLQHNNSPPLIRPGWCRTADLPTLLKILERSAVTPTIKISLIRIFKGGHIMFELRCR
jgi:hypothetical protein